MTHIIRLMLVAVIVAAAVPAVHAQTAPAKKPSISLGTELPRNPAIRFGTLPNGLTYYIMKNAKPEKRAELRLAVNAGSVLESNAQVGLAHFVEHMAFNGTRAFKKDELVKYLESIGTRFGADLNAYTSFDETVYMLQVPTDKTDLLMKGLQVLEEWAQYVSFDPDEIEKERGVIIEELRLGRGASQRMRDKQFPILFKNSLYADRLPIGTKANLETFPHDTLRRFYRDWYRPDLMAVIAVGDFDVDAVEKTITERFSRLTMPENAPTRALVPVPDHEETLFALASDPEATSTSISVYYKRDPKPEKRVMDYRRRMIEGAYSQMFNARLDELTRVADPPYLYAFGGGGRFIRSKDMYTLSAGVKPDGVLRGLEAVLTEAERVRAHGFTETELERAKTSLLRFMEQAYEERDKTESSSHAGEFVRNFLVGEPIPGIEYEYELYKKYIPSLTLAEVNALAVEYAGTKNRVVMLSMPEKAGMTMPKESELKAVLDGVVKKTIEAYVDKVSLKPLIETLPPPSKVTSTRRIESLDVTEYTLANGVRVVTKKTDFKNDEILFGAWSPGGTSLVPDERSFSASMSAGIVNSSGVNDIDETGLMKLLTGKVVQVSPFVQDLGEGFRGSVAPKDMRTLFELVYLYFTAPRKDTAAYAAMRTQLETFLQNRGSMPEMVFSDTVTATMTSYNPRTRPMTMERMKELNLDDALAVYRDRFADASDFTFFFVGNFQPDSLRKYAETYLGALPSLKRNETWKDRGIRPPSTRVEKIVRKGIEAKSTVLVIFTGTFEWSYENRYVLSSLGEHLTRRLREQIREEKGGTYGVGVRASAERFPESRYTVIINFGCAPDRVDELTAVAFDELKKVMETGATDEDLAKITEIQKRERETSLKENGFWLGRLQTAYRNGDDPEEILRLEEMQKRLSSDLLKEAAKKYLTTDRFLKFVLRPEKDDAQ